jgi:magnesium transporter
MRDRAAGARSLIPQLLHRFRIDPAVSSGAFVTTVTDGVDYASFLGIALG